MSVGAHVCVCPPRLLRLKQALGCCSSATLLNLVELLLNNSNSTSGRRVADEPAVKRPAAEWCKHGGWHM